MARSRTLGNATKVEAGADDLAALSQLLTTSTHLVLRLSPGGEEIDLPEPLIKILRASAAALSAGHSVTVLASETILTPAEAGELLGLSRPFVARLLDQGQIPSEHLPNSTHRVVKLTDVLAFQSHRK